MREKVQVFFSLYDPEGNYSKYLGTTMISMFSNTKAKIKVHLLHDDTLLNENREKFILICNEYSQDIAFHRISLPQNLRKYDGINRFSPASLYRLFISNMFPHLEKVIYLDGDIILLMDIEELWNIDISEFSLAAVKDRVVDGSKEGKFCNSVFFKRIPILNNNYFNAGVLFLNLKKIRSKYDMQKECFSFLESNPDAPALDQESLNFLFQNDCLYLEKRFNISPEEIIQNSLENKKNMNCILHFYTWDKPWRTNKYTFNKLYWKYFRKTPWGRSIEDFIDAIMQVTPALDDGMLFQPIKSRKEFIRNFLKRLGKEFKFWK